MAGAPHDRLSWRLFLLALVGLLWLGCPARDKPLSPAAAAFRQEMRETLGKLLAVLVEPVCRNDTRACEQAIMTIYPEAPRDTLTFPFRLGIINRDGVLIYSIPPLRNIGEDYSHYQAVREALKSRRIINARLYAPDGKEVYLILAPMFKNRQLAGLLVLRLDPGLVMQRWGLGEEEFLAVDLN
ncbi:MAG: hypothetical protein K6T55_00180 [Syntrophobacterales bacterium]|nr:hypothetical protein [Syntrophobacterales bacterium]